MLIIPAGLVLILLFSKPAVAANKDLKGHWAEEIINEWSAKGFISGYNNGEFKPNTPITRAEWVKLVNSSLGYSDVQVSSFNDVKAEDWFAEDISKAQKAGYITGYDDGTFKPNNPILREEAVVMLQKILWLPSVNETSFKDSNRMAPWSRGAIGALVKQDIIKGSNGLFKPKSVLTRAEAVSLLHQLNNKEVIVFDQPGTYGPNQSQMKYPKSINLKVSGIVLQNTIVEHNLTVDEKVGEGDITLKNVNVKGNTFINGGGANSIHFENTTMLNVLIDKKTGSIRLVAEGKSLIGELNIQSNALVEAEIDSTIKQVTLTDLLPAGSTVRLTGSYESVHVLAQSIVVDIPSASIQEFSSDGKGNQIQLGKETAILKMILNAASSIVGEGGVKTAIVNSTGVKMDKAPGTIELGKDVAKDVKVQIGSSQVTAMGSKNDNTNSLTGTSSGESNNTSEPVINPSPEDKTPPILLAKEQTIPLGSDIILTSNEDGKIYIVPTSIILTNQYLEIAVKEGKGYVYNVQANIPTIIKTDTFNASIWHAVAVDTSGNVSKKIDITIYDASSLFYKGIGRIVNNDGVALSFNKPIFNNLESFEALRNEIYRSTDGGNSFNPLSDQDTITISREVVFIHLADRLSGENNVFKVTAGAFKDSDGKIYDKETISSTIKAGPYLSAESEYNILPNEQIKFSSDVAGTVYLVPYNSNNYQRTVSETAIAQGLGKKLLVGDEEVNKIVSIETDGLKPGEYDLILFSDNKDISNIGFLLNDGIFKLNSVTSYANQLVHVSFDGVMDELANNIDEIKSKISISFDGGTTFNPLSLDDEVKNYGYYLVIHLKAPYTSQDTVIKIEAGAITSRIRTVNSEIITERLKLE
jgi:hypothetical protein